MPELLRPMGFNQNRIESMESPSQQEDNNDGEEASIDLLQDPRSEMTWSRRIALRLMNKKWYNPRAGQPNQFAASQVEHVGDSGRCQANQNRQNESSYNNRLVLNAQQQQRLLDGGAYPFTHSRRENPSLEKAWAYFEHVALSRFVVPKEESTKTKKKKNCCRRIIRKFSKANKTLDRAEPGEKHLHTKLYDPVFTPTQTTW